MGYVVCAREVWKEIPRERGSLVVLRDCSLEAGPGVTSLVGRSGAGKTSLLHVLSGLDAPTRGTGGRRQRVRPERDATHPVHS